MELSYSRVVVLTKRLPTLCRNQLLKRFNQTVEGEFAEIPAAMALVMWTADFLAAAKIIAPPQRDLIFNSELGNDLYKFGELLRDYYQAKSLPVAHLCIVNRSYATVTRVGHDSVLVAADNDPVYLDLSTGDLVNLGVVFAKTPIEVVSYNLTALFSVRMQAYNNLKKLNKEAQYALR